MKSVLSTKKLSLSQRELLLNASVSLVEYNAIKIQFEVFEIPPKIKNAIFTSQNGVHSFFENNRSSEIKNCFCVGEKTKLLLEKNGLKVIKMTEYAADLASYLVENHKDDTFHFFCGNIRSEEIPSKLKENNVSFQEIVAYKTTLNPIKINRQFNAVLFFSPSGVRSFFLENKLTNGTAVCIGTTTASEAREYTENVVISNTTTVESVIAKAAKLLIT
ncbi:uroporphyrinogen-III synthase [Aequorivita marisscotiae]|uniref:Uroporphyrinogen-III synthase n=1 Tax=Aequorivita marisscotiae TaxID=3040348 RepID=A0ABY8L0D7_9FLAO|nr:uroporphyrinogen-III synthase [Aequorivita sp. Ant34-E75]WGF93667.1 uroporphyrinogen-III synthase [Aequorivita sp. Ant34-E75]